MALDMFIRYFLHYTESNGANSIKALGVEYPCDGLRNKSVSYDRSVTL